MKMLFLTTITLASKLLFAQLDEINSVNIDDLTKLESKFYLVYPKPFTGRALEQYPNGKAKFLWEIKKGIVRQFAQFSPAGQLLLEENFNSHGVLHGRYIQLHDSGDTLSYGIYKNGKKHGFWITVNSDSSRSIQRYKNGSRVSYLPLNGADSFAAMLFEKACNLLEHSITRRSDIRTRHLSVMHPGQASENRLLLAIVLVTPH